VNKRLKVSTFCREPPNFHQSGDRFCTHEPSRSLLVPYLNLANPNPPSPNSTVHLPPRHVVAAVVDLAQTSAQLLDELRGRIIISRIPFFSSSLPLTQPSFFSRLSRRGRRKTRDRTIVRATRDTSQQSAPRSQSLFRLLLAVIRRSLTVTRPSLHFAHFRSGLRQR
jgi:hypothetical protein